MHLFARFESIISIPQELASHGHKATLIPVLSFKFVSLNTLSDKVNYIMHTYKLFLNFFFSYMTFLVVYDVIILQLFQPEKHGGLIFTSPRAVEAVKMCLEAEGRREGERVERNILLNIIIYKNLNPFSSFYYVCALLIEF